MQDHLAMQLSRKCPTGERGGAWVALEGEKPCATPRLRVKVERNEASHKVKVAPGYLTP